MTAATTRNTRASPWLSLPFSTLVAIFMVSLSLAPRSWQTPLAAQPIRNPGDISYGIYLSHMVITYTIAGELTLPQDGNLKSLPDLDRRGGPASVIYGYLSARFLEQPIRRWAANTGVASPRRSRPIRSRILRDGGLSMEAVTDPARLADE